MSFFRHDPPHPHHSPRRQFLRKGFAFFGALGAASAVPRQMRAGEPVAAPANRSASETQTPTPPAQAPPKPAKTDPRPVFDAHLHCPSKSGEV